jgi:hypothetical protein
METSYISTLQDMSTWGEALVRQGPFSTHRGPFQCVGGVEKHQFEIG